MGRGRTLQSRAIRCIEPGRKVGDRAGQHGIRVREGRLAVPIQQVGPGHAVGVEEDDQIRAARDRRRRPRIAGCGETQTRRPAVDAQDAVRVQ